MECQEDRSDRTPAADCDGAPEEIGSQHDANGSGCDGCKLRAADEPYWPQVPSLAMAFVRGHVVDRALFDVHQRPCHCGGRLSRKAIAPSRWSSLAYSRATLGKRPPRTACMASPNESASLSRATSLMVANTT